MKRTIGHVAATLTMLLMLAGCGKDSAPAPAQADADGATPSAGSRDAAAPNAPLRCPSGAEMASMSDGRITDVRSENPVKCSYSGPNGWGVTIASEDVYDGAAGTIDNYRAELLDDPEFASTFPVTVTDLDGFGAGAFVSTITATGSGSSTVSVVVPRPNGQFIMVNAAQGRSDGSGKLRQDQPLSEKIARAFIDYQTRGAAQPGEAGESTRSPDAPAQPNWNADRPQAGETFCGEYTTGGSFPEVYRLYESDWTCTSGRSALDEFLTSGEVSRQKGVTCTGFQNGSVWCNPGSTLKTTSGGQLVGPHLRGVPPGGAPTPGT